jgi:hypothetical protein
MELFDSQHPYRRRMIVCKVVKDMGLSALMLSKRLMYEMGGRPGYTIETLRDVILMITFEGEEQQKEFIERIRDATLEEPVADSYGLTGPTGSYVS